MTTDKGSGHPIADREERIEAARLLSAWADAEKNRYAVDIHEPDDYSDLPEHLQKSIVEIEKDCANKEFAIRTECRLRIEEVLSAAGMNADATRVGAANAAEKAYMNHIETSGRSLLADGYGYPVICARSGLPIWDDEEILEGRQDVVIRATVLPPNSAESSS